MSILAKSWLMFLACAPLASLQAEDAKPQAAAPITVQQIQKQAEAARKENGVVFFEVFQRIDRPNQFAVLGAWTNQMAYDAHAAGDNAKKFAEKLSGPMMVAT